MYSKIFQLIKSLLSFQILKFNHNQVFPMLETSLANILELTKNNSNWNSFHFILSLQETWPKPKANQYQTTLCHFSFLIVPFHTRLIKQICINGVFSYLAKHWKLHIPAVIMIIASSWRLKLKTQLLKVS